MKRPRTIGIHPHPTQEGALMIVWPSADPDQRDAFKSLTIPSGALKILRENWGVLIQNPELPVEEAKPHGLQRAELVITILEERPGMRAGAVCSELLDREGKDSEDPTLRKQTLGFLNELDERGIVWRDPEDRFWPIEMKTDSAVGSK